MTRRSRSVAALFLVLLAASFPSIARANTAPEGVTLRGTVTDTAGHPIAGARIWVPFDYDPFAKDKSQAPSAVSGADGKFAVPGLPPKPFSLWVCADGFLQGTEAIPFPDEPVRVSLKPAAMVRGRVLGPDGEPQPGATVRAIPSSYNSGIMRFPSACPPEELVTADAEGRYAFGRLEPGRLTLTATAAGFRPGTSDPLQLEAGTPFEDLEIQLQKGTAVAGRVLDPAGEPIPGARLATWIGPIEITAISEADGTYRLDGLPPGNLRINAWADRFRTRLLQIDVPADGVTADVVLEPEKDPFEISGRVLGPSGAAVEDASVSVYGTRVSSARDGSFVLRVDRCQCDQPQEVTIFARKPGFAPGRTTVLLTADRIEGVVVPLETGAQVRGRVLGLAAADLPSIEITLSLPPKNGGGQVEMASSHPDAQGRFRLGPIPAGTWQVDARYGPWVITRSLVLDPGQTEASVELTFPPVWEVSGRVLDPDGRPAARAMLYLFTTAGEHLGTGWTHSDGTFSLRAPAGDLKLSVSHQDLHGQHMIRVEAAPVSGVEVRLERGIMYP